MHIHRLGEIVVENFNQCSDGLFVSIILYPETVVSGQGIQALECYAIVLIFLDQASFQRYEMMPVPQLRQIVRNKRSVSSC